jgi:two-component system LytT family response regulator
LILIKKATAMIRTIIIDDEPRNIKLIAGIIQDHCPELEVVGTTDDLSEALPLIQSLKPSLLLLDIEFPSGNIFPVLENLTDNNFRIIFITAHNTYATEAFKQHAVDYMLKPVTPESLIQSVKRAAGQLRNDVTTDISRLTTALRWELTHSRKIPLPSAEGILFIDEEDIIRCEASGRYSIIYLKEKQKLTVTKTLKDIEALLHARQFFRVHHSHIINLAVIKKYQPGRGGTVVLADDSLVEVSPSRKEQLLDILLNRVR